MMELSLRTRRTFLSGLLLARAHPFLYCHISLLVISFIARAVQTASPLGRDEDARGEIGRRKMENAPVTSPSAEEVTPV